MNATQEEFVSAVAQFVTESNRGKATPSVQAETDLLGTGLVDSLSLMQLLFFLEERFQVAPPLDRITPANIKDARSLYNLFLASA